MHGPFSLRLSRRAWLSGVAALGATLTARPALAGAAALSFDELYASFSPLGLEFSDKVKALTGQEVRIRGFMAPPLRAEAKFFVLTQIPMALCPFCSSDADWPDNIVVVYLDHRQTFTQPNRTIEVTGVLDRGAWVDPDTGFVSQLRLRQAQYDAV
ncbi:hypothetical protein EOW65_00085 [Sinirhodobacter ferrireducens]|uniref:DUF3299 domain-containing protein n=1 Tax=Paenirhodobacter ferrireducens TaxID=1215032 RepID=A0A443LUU6_9RHOB|nr:hypothetical protein [Sinirhodobacter ferrireducens]RWR52908.1 hypothetical protein EOW65_00085 [Sinirhodobacter ferrireducens]